MRVLIEPDNYHPMVRVEFDVEIPAFPCPSRRGFGYTHNGMLFSRNGNLVQEAEAMACENAGKLPFEFSDKSASVFEGFLRGLLTIEGFIGVHKSDRYGVDVAIGKLFKPLAIAKKFANAIQIHFYPSKQIVYMKMDDQSHLPNTDPKSQKPNHSF